MQLERLVLLDANRPGTQTLVNASAARGLRCRVGLEPGLRRASPLQRLHRAEAQSAVFEQPNPRRSEADFIACIRQELMGQRYRMLWPGAPASYAALHRHRTEFETEVKLALPSPKAMAALGDVALAEATLEAAGLTSKPEACGDLWRLSWLSDEGRLRHVHASIRPFDAVDRPWRVLGEPLSKLKSFVELWVKATGFHGPGSVLFRAERGEADRFRLLGLSPGIADDAFEAEAAGIFLAEMSLTLLLTGRLEQAPKPPKSAFARLPRPLAKTQKALRKAENRLRRAVQPEDRWLWGTSRIRRGQPRLAEALSAAKHLLLVDAHGELLAPWLRALFLAEEAKDPPSSAPLKLTVAGLSERAARGLDPKLEAYREALGLSGCEILPGEPVSPDLVREADLILVMNPAERRAMQRRFSGLRGKLFLASEISVDPRVPPVLQDPSAFELSAYQETRIALELIARRWLERRGGGHPGIRS